LGKNKAKIENFKYNIKLNTNMLDKIDRKVLEELQKDADRRIYQIKKATQIPRSTIHNRIKKLKKEKIITKIKAVVDPLKLELNVCVLVHIVTSSRKGAHAIAERLAKTRNVEEVFITAGVFDIIAKARFKSNNELSDFIFNDKTGLKVWEGIERSESMICLETVKENGILE
jgi:Lrp/AsnC family transcriptional regulator for asnA, asnC and gidA